MSADQAVPEAEMIRETEEEFIMSDADTAESGEPVQEAATWYPDKYDRASFLANLVIIGAGIAGLLFAGNNLVTRYTRHQAHHEAVWKAEEDASIAMCRANGREFVQVRRVPGAWQNWGCVYVNYPPPDKVSKTLIIKRGQMASCLQSGEDNICTVLP